MDVIPDKEERLKVENIFMYKLQTIYPYGLNSDFNGVRVTNKKNSCTFLVNLFYMITVLVFTKEVAEEGVRSNYKIDILKVMDSINKEDVKIQNINEKKAKIFSLKNKFIKWFIRCKLNNYIF